MQAGSAASLAERADPKLAGPGQDRILEFRRRAVVELGVLPVDAAGAGLAEDGDTNAVGAQLALQDVDRRLEPLIG